MTDELELRAAWSLVAGHDRAADAVADSLLSRHREPHRHYHGVRHVVWVLRHVQDLATEQRVDDLPAVLAAACFHDAIYEPGRADNEDASARLAERELGTLGWPDDRCAAVGAMVRATATHVAGDDGDSPSADTAVLLDADLAVLGADAPAYLAYVTGVRAEYGHVGDDAWRAGRSAVLDGFLARPAIYATAGGRRRWESRARANMSAERAGLR